MVVSIMLKPYMHVQKSARTQNSKKHKNTVACRDYTCGLLKYVIIKKGRDNKK